MASSRIILEDELALLWRATRSTRSRFIIVQCNHYDLVRRVMSELAARYPERPLRHFDLRERLPADFPHSLLHFAEGFICLAHFEELFKSKHEAAVVALNQRRDAFASRDTQLLFFLPDGQAALQSFAQRLPDLYSTVNPIVQLRQSVSPPTAAAGFPSFAEFTALYADRAEAEADIRRIHSRLEQLAETPETARLRFALRLDLGRAYQFLGRYNHAQTILASLLNAAGPLLTPAEVATIQLVMAQAHHGLGEYVEAANLLQEALQAATAELGSEHAAVSHLQNGLAMALREMGDYAGAKAVLEQALASAERSFGEEHPTTAAFCSNLGLVLQDLGDYAKAKVLLEQAVASDERNFGEENPTTAVRYSNLASTLHALGDRAKAKALLEQALASNERNFGSDHPIIAVNCINLGVLLGDMGDYAQARPFLNRALSIFQAHFGAEHPKALQVISLLEQVNELEKKKR